MLCIYVIILIDCLCLCDLADLYVFSYLREYFYDSDFLKHSFKYYLSTMQFKLLPTTVVFLVTFDLSTL